MMLFDEEQQRQQGKSRGGSGVWDELKNRKIKLNEKKNLI